MTQKLKTATAALDSEIYVAPCKMTVAEWLDIWLAEYLNDVKPLIASNYADQVRNHLKPAFGATKLEAIDTHTIQKFYNTLYNNGKGLSAKTIKNINGVFHSALQQAVANGYIRHNPTDACKLPKVVKLEIKPLEPDEIARLLEEAQKNSCCNVFIVAMFTGMRQGEVLGLPWSCVNFTTGVITIQQQLQCKNGEYFLETPKNGKKRTILPAPLVMDALRKEQEKQKMEQLQAGNLWNNPFNLVFTDGFWKEPCPSHGC